MDIEESTLVQKYETLLYAKKSIYFDVAEFDIIVSHYIYEGQYLDALEVLVHAKDCHPDNRELEYYKVKIFIALEEYEKAINLIEELEPILPNSFELNILRGQVHLILYGDIDKAVEQFKIALANITSIDNDAYDIPDFLIEYGYYEDALYFLEIYINKFTADAVLLYQTAHCYDKLEQFDKSEQYYEKSLDEDPFDEKTWIALGILNLSKNNLQKALDSFEFALSINENNYVAALCRINTFIQTNEYDNAMEAIKELLYKMPDDANTMYCLGACYEKTQNVAKAEESYLKSIENDPEFAQPYWGLAKIMLLQNNVEGAIKLLDKALENDPDNDEYLFLRGQSIILLSADALSNFISIQNMEIADSNDEFINKYKKAIFFYSIGNMEQCCKYLIESIKQKKEGLEMFFKVYPEAKNDAYVINYLGKYIK